MGLLKRFRVKEDINRYLDLRYRLTELILDIMELKGVNKTMLSEKMGKKPSEITKLLSVDHNLTLKSIAKIETALETEFVKLDTTYHELKRSQLNRAYLTFSTFQTTLDLDEGVMLAEDTVSYGQKLENWSRELTTKIPRKRKDSKSELQELAYTKV